MYEFAKLGVEVLTSLAAGNVASTVIGAFKPSNLTKIGEISWLIGTLAVGGAAAAAGVKYVGDTMDGIRNTVTMFKKDKASA